MLQEELPVMLKETIVQQCQNWNNVFSENPDAFGEAPSQSAQKAVGLFKNEGVETVLELGGGAGRDTIYLAQNGFRVSVLDFCDSSVETITRKAQASGLSQSVSAMRHDVRNTIPFGDESFDACYSFGLYCGALLTTELEFLSDEIRRVLKPGELNVYSVRTTEDPRYGTGTHRGGDMYEVGPFIVHFFSKEKVEHLAKGFEIIDIDEFEEGDLPRRLFRVTLRKK
ncbi:MAG: class I SAM-dependent methyltransferase [Dehalococcoidales bacterium]|jgi:SAM-dependent methyltransferase|nr:SAM-dependent methyltransferase [Dehalococcoidales bacterium]MDP6501231.1 class I SAM-dependent methyltransferase [Dehalococcoidales bacterium]MDP6632936.1 class I SAM-dependent methyltransferase [Dehalococcoidales bacterium]